MRRILFVLSLLASVSALTVSTLVAQTVIRVPQDVGSLVTAINQVPDGGIIEMAAGTYAAPSNGGFRIRFTGKSFAIRAAAGATVVLSGQSNHTIALVEDSAPGRPITFERLTFRDGRGTGVGEAGAVTVNGGDALFDRCTFASNEVTQTTTGGGGVRVINEGLATIRDTVFTGNRAQLRGGAIEVLSGGHAEIERVTFDGNEAQLTAGGNNNASGGALFVLDATARVVRSRFEDNVAGFAGGAINVFGLWIEPPGPQAGEEAATVEVANSTFVGNRAEADSCCPTPGNQASVGGAIHAEDQARVIVGSSRFFENVAQRGGAIDSYRALIEVSESTFRGNRARIDTGSTAAGGTFNLVSNDFSDNSTNGGAINRRPAAMTLADSYVQGRFGATGSAAHQGGCLFAAGDRSRLLGNGVPQDGGVDENVATMVLTNVTFDDCDVEPSSDTGAFGGAMALDLVDLTLDDSLLMDSDALGGNAFGGGIAVNNRTQTTIRGTTFANNRAEQTGGAINFSSSTNLLDGCLFLDNEVSPGTSEPVSSSLGAAIFALPILGEDGGPSRDITGTVSNSTFVTNVGLAIRETESNNAGPISQLRFTDNTFFETTFGQSVYNHSRATPLSGQSATALDNLTVNHADGRRTDKGSGNTNLSSEPDVGTVVGAPTQVLASGATGDASGPTTAFLAFARNGGSASVGGQPANGRTGVREVTQAGTFALVVDGTQVDEAEITAVDGSGSCVEGPEATCLQGERFKVEVDWRTAQGQTGKGQVFDFGTPDSGLLFFFNPNNLEMLVKVLDNCSGFTNRYWVFSAATTTLEYTLTVTDTETGVVQTYFNPLGNSASAITDTNAFATCDAAAGVAPAATLSTLAEPGIPPEVIRTEYHVPTAKAGSCVPDTDTMCLRDGRFQVDVSFRTGQNVTGSGQVVDPGSSDSGLFFFFNPNNLEMLVKVLNNCNGFTNRYWVFAAATTTLEYTLTVTDTMTGATVDYFNPLGNSSAAITDTGAFATCP